MGSARGVSGNGKPTKLPKVTNRVNHRQGAVLSSESASRSGSRRPDPGRAGLQPTVGRFAGASRDQGTPARSSITGASTPRDRDSDHGEPSAWPDGRVNPEASDLIQDLIRGRARRARSGVDAADPATLLPPPPQRP